MPLTLSQLTAAESVAASQQANNTGLGNRLFPNTGVDEGSTNRWFVSRGQDGFELKLSRFGSATPQEAIDERVYDLKNSNKHNLEEINEILCVIQNNKDDIAKLLKVVIPDSEPASQPASNTVTQELPNTHASLAGQRLHEQHRCSCYRRLAS